MSLHLSLLMGVCSMHKEFSCKKYSSSYAYLSPTYYDYDYNNTSVYSESNIYRLSDHYAFAKPNDRRALDLMNAAAVEVMKELPDLCIAYGVSDEFRYVQLVSSLSSQLLTVLPQFCLPPQLPTF